MAIVQTNELSKRFRKVNAVDRLTLDVAEGSVFALVGPNGAGKSTLLKILLNILQPSEGIAEVLGRDTRRLGISELRNVGYVSENQELPSWMTVEYFLRYVKGFYPSWNDDDAAALVSALELPLNRRLRDLSRGMRMKAALVSVLAYHPRLVVLDEPFGGLDVLVRDQVIECLLERVPEATMLIASHDIAEMESFASHIGFLDRGCLRFAEETRMLSDRFREVEVRTEQPVSSAARWPETWKEVEFAANLIRFTDSGFERERTESLVRELIPGVREITAHPMHLRDIFVSEARRSS